MTLSNRNTEKSRVENAVNKKKRIVTFAFNVISLKYFKDNDDIYFN